MKYFATGQALVLKGTIKGRILGVCAFLFCNKSFLSMLIILSKIGENIERLQHLEIRDRRNCFSWFSNSVSSEIILLLRKFWH